MNKRELLKALGQAAFHKQIRDWGGVLTTQKVAELFDISHGAVIKRLEHGSLLGVPFEESTSFPIWQFDENGMIDYFVDIMAMLNTSSPISIVQFFLTYDHDLSKTPIEALKGGDPVELEMARLLARQFHQQIAR